MVFGQVLLYSLICQQFKLLVDYSCSDASSSNGQQMQRKADVKFLQVQEPNCIKIGREATVGMEWGGQGWNAQATVVVLSKSADCPEKQTSSAGRYLEYATMVHQITWHLAFIGSVYLRLYFSQLMFYVFQIYNCRRGLLSLSLTFDSYRRPRVNDVGKNSSS